MLDTGTGLLGLLILIADIYAIIKIAQSSASTISKAVWIVVVLFFPVIGLIIWYLMGPKGS
ncbi:MAG: PLD nuclease N-terminal domain-containing protein [Candidatus Sedimenticola sp. PURPLELP]